jgi:ubiquitin C-terminal hydrolase
LSVDATHQTTTPTSPLGVIEQPDINGLKNIGSTCYINSIIQALFHIPKFRQLIFNCSIIHTKSSNPLFELQKLFYKMQFEKKTFFGKQIYKDNQLGYWISSRCFRVFGLFF